MVRDASGRFVLLRRGFDPGKGLWTFPGGFVDLGESVEEAAIRETREELVVDIELGRLIGVYSRADDRVALVVFAATTTQKPRTSFPGANWPSGRPSSPSGTSWAPAPSRGREGLREPAGPQAGAVPRAAC